MFTFILISSNKTLKELYLGSNKIEINGSVALAESLKHNNALKKLDLQGIRLGTAGVLAMSDGIRVNSSLSHLVLELDKLTKEEGALIAEAVKQNTTLLEFNIGDTDKIDADVVYSIETTLRLNKVITGLLETTGFNDHVRA